MGRLVLASDDGGHLELIRHDETGIIFKADDREDFLNRAVIACEDPRLRCGIASAARRYVETERVWRGLVANYLPMYEAVARH